MNSWGAPLPQLLDRILSNIPDSLFLVVDNDGVVSYCNPAVERWLQYTGRELIGSHIQDLTHPLLVVFQANDWWEQANTSGIEQTIEWQHDGKLEPIRIRLNHLTGSSGYHRSYLYQATKMLPAEAYLL